MKVVLVTSMQKCFHVHDKKEQNSKREPNGASLNFSSYVSYASLFSISLKSIMEPIAFPPLLASKLLLLELMDGIGQNFDAPHAKKVHKE